MPRCVVTGGAGFLGSHLAEHLVRVGHEVTVVDDLSTGRAEHLEGLRSAPGFRFERGDAADPAFLARAAAGAGAFFHLAAVVGVRQVMADPGRTFDVNTRLTQAVLDVASNLGTPVLLASSSEVYGQGPFDEDRPLDRPAAHSPRWCYAASKLAGEDSARQAGREHGLPVVIARLFNAAGPRQTGRYGMVVPRFVRQALAGEPLSVYGDGSATRCFMHAREAVAALAALLFCREARNGVVNVGSTAEVSILQLARRVQRVTGSASPVRCVPYEQALPPGFEDVARRVPVTGRVHDLIGWEARMPLDRILADVTAAVRTQAVFRPRSGRPEDAAPARTRSASDG